MSNKINHNQPNAILLQRGQNNAQEGNRKADMTNAPAVPRDPAGIGKLGFGAMLKIKFNAALSAIGAGSPFSYEARKTEAKASLRMERQNRFESAQAGQKTYGDFDKPKDIIARLKENDQNSLSLQLAPLIEDCTVNNEFDARDFYNKMQTALTELKYTEFTDISVVALQEAADRFREQSTFDPARGVKADATETLIAVLTDMKDERIATNLFLDKAKEQVRAGKEQTFLRSDGQSAPLVFIARAKGGSDLYDDSVQIGVEVRESPAFKEAAETLGVSRMNEQDEIEPYTTSDPSITEDEAELFFDVADTLLDKMAKLKPAPELKTFLDQMRQEIVRVKGDTAEARAMVNRLFVDQIFLRTLNSGVVTTLAQGEANRSFGGCVTQLFQIAANGLKGGVAKMLDGSPIRDVTERRGAALMNRMNDLLVKTYGMPESSHVKGLGKPVPQNGQANVVPDQVQRDEVQPNPVQPKIRTAPREHLEGVMQRLGIKATDEKDTDDVVTDSDFDDALSDIEGDDEVKTKPRFDDDILDEVEDFEDDSDNESEDIFVSPFRGATIDTAETEDEVGANIDRLLNGDTDPQTGQGQDSTTKRGGETPETR